MNIFDLSHFEEVLAEAPSIVGGIVLPSTQLALSGIGEIDEQISGSINIGNITNVSQVTPTTNASSTLVQFTAGNLPGQASTSVSIAT